MSRRRTMPPLADRRVRTARRWQKARRKPNRDASPFPPIHLRIAGLLHAPAAIARAILRRDTGGTASAVQAVQNVQKSRSEVLNILNMMQRIGRQRNDCFVAAEFCETLAPAVHDAASRNRGDISQATRRRPAPAWGACRIHPASASTRKALARRSLPRSHDQPGC